MQGDRRSRDRERSRERSERDRRDDRDRRDRDRDGGRERGGGGGGRDRDREERERERERESGRPSGASQRRGDDWRGSRGADERDARPRPSGGLPPRAPSNPLIAEAYRLAKLQQEKALAEKRAGGGGGGGGENEDEDDEPVERPPSRGWRAAAEEERDASPEDGELPAGAAGEAQQGAAAAGAGGDGAGSGGDAKKRKHAPIVWHTPPKVPKTGMAHVGSSKGLDSLAAGGAGGGGATSAADRAMQEVLAFQLAQQAAGGGSGDDGGDDDGRPFLKPSPSVSSEEEEEEEGRGGRSGAAQRSSSGSPAGAAGTASMEDEEAGTAPPQPKRASRWLDADADAAEAGGGGGKAAAGGQRHGGGGSPGGGGGASDASSDAERQQQQQRGGDGEGSDEEEGGSSPHGPRKRAISMLDECRDVVSSYQQLNRISEGTYGIVYRACDLETGEICALKRIKLTKERDGFPLTSVREINILLSLDHPHIVNVSEVVVGRSLDDVFMVMEYADHDLKAVMEHRMTQPFSVAEVKTLMLQLLSGMAYLHDNWVLHRDLKTSNILYTNKGELKLCDFGLARQYGSPLAAYTHMVVTLWYRAPELLLGQRKYSTAVDVWSIGCIMAELLSKEPLFPGKSEIDELQLILKTMGSPTEETWPGLSKLPNARKFNLGKYPSGSLRQRFPPAGLGFDGRTPLSEAGFDLLSRLLELCPERRISCADAIDHPWFREQPLPKDKALMPTFPATNAERREAAAAKAAAAVVGGKKG